MTLRLLPLCLICLALASCSALKGKPADTLYVLKAATPAGSCAKPLSLKVSVPHLAPGLDTTRIAVADSANHLTYYTGVAWADTLSDILHHYWSDALGKSGAFAHVSTDLDTAKADWVLQTDVQEFHFTPAGETKLRLTAKLLDAPTRTVKATIPLEKTVSTTGSMEQRVARLNQALDETTGELLTRLLAAAPPCMEPATNSKIKLPKKAAPNE